MRRALLAWFRKSRRDLPWRRTRDPYAIWVAEIMLQQTRVAVVVPHYLRFLARFPDVRALARAREDDVLAAWSGLGYYRRARALRAAAIEVRERHAGRVPSDPAELVRLPGIGRYTAGAIASQAFGAREPVVDGNVRRVLARIFGLAGRSASEASLWSLAGELVDPAHPGDWNQALMELGAVVCTPAAPACARCPVARRCEARASGDPGRYPERRRAVRTKARVAVALLVRRGRVLLERPRGGNPLRGTWDLPAVEIDPDSDPRALLEAGLALRRDRATAGVEVTHASHAILDRTLRLEVFACRPLADPPVRGGSLRWVRPGSLSRVPVSGATQKILRATAGIS